VPLANSCQLSGRTTSTARHRAAPVPRVERRPWRDTANQAKVCRQSSPIESASAAGHPDGHGKAAQWGFGGRSNTSTGVFCKRVPRGPSNRRNRSECRAQENTKQGGAKRLDGGRAGFPPHPGLAGRPGQDALVNAAETLVAGDRPGKSARSGKSGWQGKAGISSTPPSAEKGRAGRLWESPAVAGHRRTLGHCRPLEKGYDANQDS